MPASRPYTPDAQPFVRVAKAQTMLRDFERARKLIRERGDPETQDAWDRCERWVSCIDPNARTDR